MGVIRSVFDLDCHCEPGVPSLRSLRMNLYRAWQSLLGLFKTASSQRKPLAMTHVLKFGVSFYHHSIFGSKNIDPKKAFLSKLSVIVAGMMLDYRGDVEKRLATVF